MRVNVLTSGAGGVSEQAMKPRLTAWIGWVGVSVIGWQIVSAAAPAHPMRLSPAEAATVLKEIAKDRTDTQKWLQSDPTSYLATIDRRDFEQRKTLSVGRAADNDVRIDDPAVAAHHVKVTVDGDRFHVVAVDQEARFKIPGEKDAKVWQETRDATVDPSSIQIGRFLLRLSHQRFPAIIVFDPQSPRFKLYKGIQYFPPDLSYRYELALTPNPKPETTVIMSTRGNQRRADKVGWFDFVVGTTPVRLEALRLLEPGVGENDLGIFFRDATTGKESYELGRYVDVKKLANDNYLLDFNFTYNPACAYSDHYNCPIPPKANVLPVAIRAGEMDAHYH
jgi:uncharacterized protein (DUF1684 family)